VVDFSNERGWYAKDGRVFFPETEGVDGDEGGEAGALGGTGGAGNVIGNALGYARELEMIV